MEIVCIFWKHHCRCEGFNGQEWSQSSKGIRGQSEELGTSQILQLLHVMDFFNEYIVKGTNRALIDSGVRRMLTLAELKQWFGIWFLMSLHPQYSMEKFFFAEKKGEKRNRDKFWNPHCCGKFITHNHFKDILFNLWLCNDPPPNYCDRSWMIHPLSSHLSIQWPYGRMLQPLMAELLGWVNGCKKWEMS